MRARSVLLLATAMLMAARSFADETISATAPSPAAIVVASTPSEPPVDSDLAAESEPKCDGEFGTIEEVASGTCFGEALAGYYRSGGVGPTIPHFNYVPIAFRLGYRPWEDRGYIASRISLLAEWTVDPIVTSYGNYMTGGSVMVRYDVCPDGTICPYVQGGTGFVLTDAYRDRQQLAIGELFEFLQQVELGVRWKLTDCLAIESECGLQHVSNARLANRNHGANDFGASIGVRWTFGGR